MPREQATTALHVGRLLAVYGLVGCLAGLAAVGFANLIELGTALFFAEATAGQNFDLTWPSGWRLFVVLIPMVGGLLSGILCAAFAPEAMGTGIDHVVDAYHNRDGDIRARVPVVKAVAASLTLGSGGSGGVEGPIAQIAAGIGSFVARRFGLTGRERRVLMMSGFAAGIGAVFHAPMAAAIFSAEVLYTEMDIEHEVLVPGIIASTVAYGVFGAIHGWAPLFTLPDVSFGHPLQLLAYLALALILAAASIGFISLYRAVSRTIGRARFLPLWARPAVGGLLVGLIGLLIPSALGAGYRIVDTAVMGHAPILILVLLAGAKALTSCLTAGTGGASGLFGPSLVVGGALGGAVGGAAAALFPELGIQPAAFVVVGMAGFFSAVVSAPLSTVIMVAEVVGSYRLIVPALWVCTLAWLLTRRWHLWGDQAATRLDAPANLADMMGGVLHRISVAEAIRDKTERPVTVAPELDLRELVHHFAHSQQSVFPIVRLGKLLGVVDGRQLRRTIGEQGVDTLLIAHDFQVKAETVAPSDTLYTAISRMTASGYDELVVSAEDDPESLAGLISRREVVTAYHRRMLARAPDASAEARTEEVCDLPTAIERGGMLLGVGGAHPAEVIGLLVARADLPEECDRKGLLQRLLERETLGSTGVGQGIALPHPHADELRGIDQPVVVIGLLKRPVDWNAYDERPVDIVCVLLSPSGETHLKLLGELARVLSDGEVCALLRQHAPLKKVLRVVRTLLKPAAADE